MQITKRSIVKGVIYILGLLFLLFIITGIVLVLNLSLCSTVIEHPDKMNSWEAAYYIFAIISSIGTLTAVIVALSKEMLLKWLNSPNLNVEIIEGKVLPIYDEQDDNIPSAYRCLLKIINKGGIAAISCRAYVNDVQHAYNGKKEKLKDINNECQKKQMLWSNHNIDILQDIPTELDLFKIVNPNQLSTPQLGNIQLSPQISFNGCIIPKKRSQKGLWQIEYYISSKNGSVTRFLVSVDWSGEWTDKPEDMKDYVTIDCKKI